VLGSESLVSRPDARYRDLRIRRLDRSSEPD
jgi:hypothetical protein